MARSLKRVNDALKRRRHSPIQILGAWLRAVLNGHYQYYAVPGNLQAIRSYHNAVLRSWHRTLRSRSQRDRKTWRQMWQLATRWLPPPRIRHPYPEDRFTRQYLRQEPGAVVPHAGICAGGAS